MQTRAVRDTMRAMTREYEIRAEVRLPTTDLRADLGFFGNTLGMRLDMIYPADDPSVAVYSGHGLRVRLEQGDGANPGLRILTDDPDFAQSAKTLESPGGTTVDVHPLHPPLELPQTDHAFVVRRLADQAPWVIGRAGMQYRDLIPNRLGGPIRLTAGDCFIQPPEIRHRVLEASDGIEVIEIGVPAEHITEIDHDMTLPTPHLRPDREWQGQRFVYNTATDAQWQPSRLTGFVSRDTTIAANTRDVAGVNVLRRGQGDTGWTTHDADIYFTFVMEGTMTLQGDGKDPYALAPGDAFVIPPGMATRYADPSDDLELLEVTLPGAFQTHQSP